jgi:hypothetical protein
MMRILYALGWFLAALLPLTDSDIWWQLACGRSMVEQGAYLRFDPLTFTTENQVWVNVHWAYQWILFQIHQWIPDDSAWALLLFHAILWGLGAWLWTGKNRSSWLLLLLPLVFLDRYLLLARPLAMTLVILGMQWRLYSSSMPLQMRWIGILFLQVLLANIQGLFLLGPILWVLHGFAERIPIKPLLMGCLGLVLASSVHPWGPRILLYPFGLLDRIRTSGGS